MEPIISVIIPTKDRNSILRHTVKQGLKALEKIEADIIIVNDSKTNKIDIGEIHRNNVHIFDNPKSGVSAARNFGASVAKADLLIFLDDDMLIFKENIETTLALHRRFPGISFNLNWTYPPDLLNQCQKLQFGRYLIKHGFTSLRGWGGGERWKEWDDVEMFEVDALTAQFLTISKSAFNAVGGFDEKIPFPVEDYDFSVRLKNIGIKLFIYPKSTVYHNEADKINVKSWLERKKIGARGHKFALQFRYQKFYKKYSYLKVLLHKYFWKKKNLCISVLEIIPNIKLFDFIYFIIINRLLGAFIFKGYTEVSTDDQNELVKVIENNFEQ